MVTAWKYLGFVLKNPETKKTKDYPSYYEVERNEKELGPDQDPEIPLPKS